MREFWNLYFPSPSSLFHFLLFLPSLHELYNFFFMYMFLSPLYENNATDKQIFMNKRHIMYTSYTLLFLCKETLTLSNMEVLSIHAHCWFMSFGFSIFQVQFPDASEEGLFSTSKYWIIPFASHFSPNILLFLNHARIHTHIN